MYNRVCSDVSRKYMVQLEVFEQDSAVKDHNRNIISN